MLHLQNHMFLLITIKDKKKRMYTAKDKQSNISDEILVLNFVWVSKNCNQDKSCTTEGPAME